MRLWKCGAISILVAASSTAVVLTQSASVHAPDGGTRQMLTSILIPPLPNAPFSASVSTEWTKYLSNGATQTVKNQRRIARDGFGRVFQERRTLAGDGSPMQSRLTVTELGDPVSHTRASCDPYRHVCELRPYNVPPSSVVGASGSSPDGLVTRESLGTQSMGGVDVVGTREVLTLNAAAIGTDRPIVVAKEFWYSAELGMNVFTKREDPRSGVEVFTVTDINRSEPDPSLFTLPEGVRVVDLRQSAGAVRWK